MMDAGDEADPRQTIVLSVVMPNYNHGGLISAALTAILAQCRLPDEILIIDDGSTDNSRAVIESWVAKEPRIRAVFNPENRGAIACINQGITELARGRYVCLMAADDVAHESFFETALDLLERYPQAALFCAETDVRFIDAPGRQSELRPAVRPSHRPRIFSPAESRALLRWTDNFIIPLTVVVRRNLMLVEGGFRPELGSMADGFLLRRLALQYGFCFAPKIVVQWQVRQSSLSRITSRRPETVRNLILIARDLIAADPVFPPGYADLFERRMQFSTCRLALLERPIHWSYLTQIGPSGMLDRMITDLFRRLPTLLAVSGGLAWLALRLRPYSLLALSGTLLRRRLRRPGN